jgi:hypothetical protein
MSPGAVEGNQLTSLAGPEAGRVLNGRCQSSSVRPLIFSSQTYRPPGGIGIIVGRVSG